MGKVAFVFPGQGSQYSGMGKDLQEHSAAAAEIFRLADVQRPETSAQCFYGNEAILQNTQITQPCLFATELAAAAALDEAGIVPDMIAGYSMGEITALVYAKMIDFSTGFSLLCQRGLLMKQASEDPPTVMVAVLRLQSHHVERICRDFSGVYPANYNCPGQIVVSGLADQIPVFSKVIRASGGRIVPLAVCGGFHSPFMKKAAIAFRGILEPVEIKKGNIPIYANCSGHLYGPNAKAMLSQQIDSPIFWEDCVVNMCHAGAEIFVEVGPGQVLSKLIKQIKKTAICLHVEDYLSLDITIQTLKELNS